ncbi:hypothetical protein K439DRAFT_1642486 [Ramaria rubella]|nr:hypothetical protein K439DRAFT_1642486 [Ramaria rubella]
MPLGHSIRPATRFETRQFLANPPLSTPLMKLPVHRLLLVNPIPLVSGEGLVAPERYKETLVGAVIECHVNISHWYIKQSNRDTYNASVRYICSYLLPLSID